NNSAKSAAEHQALGYRNARAIVIPNGFELDRSNAERATSAAFRTEIGANEHEVVVGLIARVHEVKDHATFLRAACGAAARVPHLRFVCLGRGTTELAVPDELRTRLHLLGERTDVHRCLAGVDLVVSSSVAEGFPNALGEAMASAVPVIATDVGETATLLEEKRDSFGRRRCLPRDGSTCLASWFEPCRRPLPPQGPECHRRMAADPTLACLDPDEANPARRSGPRSLSGCLVPLGQGRSPRGR
ncbi:MAG: glycosyltransferase, partial [bacterium]